jgi:predicted aspartyl protease
VLLGSGVSGRAETAPAPAPAAPCQLILLASLDTETMPTGDIAVNMTLNGKPRELEVDTGSYNSSITREAAAELGVQQLYTANGGAFLNDVSIDRYGFLDSLSFGAIHTTGKWAILITPDKVVPSTISGLLGPDIMKNYDVEMDFFRGKLNFFARSKCPDPVYWSNAYAKMAMRIDRNQHISVQAKLDGKPVTVVLDTGSTNSIMNRDFAHDLFDWSENDPRIKLVRENDNINGGSATSVYTFPFQTLAFESVTVNNPKISMVPKEHFMQDKSIVLGLNVLRQLHFFIAYQDDTLYITPAEAADRQVPVLPNPSPAPGNTTASAAQSAQKSSP